ncbi:hypothetical protein HRI_001344000 [Hibiscus trionum]|uniref:Endonuclease/exonuclease/phosphatase domain-containing protein n=1 Tax=Hibiscus trionum TaxID=183268 RepID=A0A9W7HFZ3_HIBTR|nr:hypothetical protein HRI_001344000 [Hibiscus trionum]
MNSLLFCWNVRGLGKPEKVRAVTKVLKSSKAKIAFLQESKISQFAPNLIKRLKGRLFSECVLSPSVGASGGIISLWDGCFFRVSSSMITDRWIGLVGQLESCSSECLLINLYAPNDLASRKRVFEDISEFIEKTQLPTLIGGDFNCVRNREERLGTATNKEEMENFHEFIQRNNLLDLPLVGDSFTWFRRGSQVSASRIDRMLISPIFLNWYPNATLSSLPRNLSDHKAIVLQEPAARSKNRPFKLFTYWLNYLDLAKAIQNVLETSSSASTGDALAASKKAIKKWVSNFKAVEEENLVGIEKKIEELEQQLCWSGPDQNCTKALQKLKHSM